MSFRFLERPPAAHYAQKTVTFHLDFGAEMLENARYEMITLYSMEHLQLANRALGRTART
jgi:hypothetical protein